jgi:DNA replicative helicase MCM subunit Mcm2 (Cdc46/Mcm family)
MEKEQEIKYEIGWDAFSPDPGSQKTMRCRVCGQEMNVKRNCEGPRSSIGAMAGCKSKYDFFSCPDAAEEWHYQALRIKQMIADTPSASLAIILEAELRKILKDKKPTRRIKRKL